MGKKSFVFYKEWKEAIEDLPDDIRLEIYESIIEYATTGNLQGLKPMAKVAFNFIKTSIDRDTEKYVSIVNRNRGNGNLGGRPRKTQRNPKNPVGYLETQRNPKNLDHDNDHDNDLNNTITTNVDNSISGTPALSKKSISDFDSRKNDFMNSCAAYIEKFPKEMIREFFDYWTEPNKSNTKMKFELEKTWSLERRLGTWEKNEIKFSKNGNIKKNGGKPSCTDEELAQSVANGIARGMAEREERLKEERERRIQP